MPNRILRDWTTSKAMGKLSAQAERLYVRLINKADDWGRYDADPKLLKCYLFPYVEGVRESDIPRWLAECREAGVLLLYEADGKRLLQIQKFGQHIRAKVSKYPPPPADASTCAQVRADAHLDVCAVIDEGAGATGPPAAAGDVQIPPNLSADPFPKKWAEWVNYRKGRKLSLSPVCLEKQLTFLDGLGLTAAVDCMETSMRNGWQGLFPPKGHPPAQQKGADARSQAAAAALREAGL